MNFLVIGFALFLLSAGQHAEAFRNSRIHPLKHQKHHVRIAIILTMTAVVNVNFAVVCSDACWVLLADCVSILATPQHQESLGCQSLLLVSVRASEAPDRSRTMTFKAYWTLRTRGSKSEPVFGVDGFSSQTNPKVFVPWPWTQLRRHYFKQA